MILPPQPIPTPRFATEAENNAFGAGFLAGSINTLIVLMPFIEEKQPRKESNWFLRIFGC